MEEILGSKSGEIFRIVLNRPEHGNCVTDLMAAELIRLIKHAQTVSRVIVISGKGQDFCLGRATMNTSATEARPEALVRRRQADLIFECYDAFRASRLPIVAIIRGRAAGFGCALAALADVTLAADTSTFQIPEMLHNIMPTMVMSALVDRVSPKALNYLVYTSRVVSAATAQSFGIVSEVASEDGLSSIEEEVCAAINSAPNPATQGVKEYVSSAYEMSLRGAVDYARNLHATINSSSEMRKVPV